MDNYQKQNNATELRRQQIEQQFQDGKEDILADIKGLELSVADLTKKYGITERTLRRWMERLGVDSFQRTLARRRGGFEKKPEPRSTKPSRAGKRYVQEAEPQAHKLKGLW